MTRFFLCLMLMFVWLQPSHAAALKPLPKIASMTRAQFDAATHESEIKFPERDKYFGLKIHIPKGWTPRPENQLKNLQTADRLFGELAWFDAPGQGKAHPFITVRSVSLDHDITAKAWLIQRIFDNAYNLRSLNERSFYDVEAIYVTYDKLVTYTTWARAVIVGPRMILVEFHVPSDTWERDRDLQNWTMKTIDVSTKDTARIEPLEAFAFLDVATFQYPKSWTLLRNIIRSPDFFRVALFNAQENETPSVQITVQAARIDGNVSLDTMKQEEQKFLDAQRVILRDKLPAPQFVPPEAKAEHIQNLVYTVSSTPGLHDLDAALKPVTKEYWLTTFDRNGTAFVISMLVPARQGVYQDWARATRTYQIVIETLAGQLQGSKPNGSNVQTDGNTAIPFLKD